MRTRTATDRDELEALVDDYIRDGYSVQTESDTKAVLEYHDSGSLLAHLALFFTIGWLTLGFLNGFYAWYRRRQTRDTVRVEV